MPQPIKVGRKERMSFAKIHEVCEMPNLIDMQTKSYKWFVEEGLGEVLEDVSPIRDTTTPSAWSSRTITSLTLQNTTRRSAKRETPRIQPL